MLIDLIRKELLTHTVTFRFVTGFILCAILVPVSAHVLTKDYTDRLNSYSLSSRNHRDELGNIQVYSELKATVDKKPNVLSILCAGLEKQSGNTVTISHGEVPTITKDHGRRNPLLVAFPELDIVTIAMVVFSLLAVLFAYDAIAGERENGTLAQILSNSIPRSHVLLGKYIGGIIPLSILVIFSLLTGLLVILRSNSVSFQGHDWIRILLIVCVILVYTSVFYTLGILASVICRHSATALMLLLFLWVLTVIIVPAIASYTASRVYTIPLEGHIENQIDMVWDQFEEESIKVRDGYPGHWWTFGSQFNESMIKVYDGEKTGMMNLLEQVRQIEPMRIKYADRVWEVYQSYYDQLSRQYMLARSLSRISPAATFYNVAAALAGTDTKAQIEFLRRSREYRNELIDYLRKKKSFESLLYFTRKTEDELRTREELRLAMMQEEDILGKGWKAISPLALDDLPMFSQRSEGGSTTIGHASVDLILLIFLTVIFFTLAHLSFLRSSVK